MAKPRKLNSMRLLDAQSIAYEVLRYDSRQREAQQVACLLGLPAQEVWKTLVLLRHSNGRPVLVLLPSNTSVNLKRLARALAEKKMSLAPHAMAESLTGLQVGGISALALQHKPWPVVLDARARACPRLVISAGQRGIQLRLATSDLLALLRCQVLDVAD